MRLLNGEIFASKEPLSKLLTDREFPVKISYGLAKIANRLSEQFNVIEQVRLNLVKKYGEIDKENPMQTQVKPESEKYSKFVEELTELMNQEVEMIIEKVKLPQEVDGKPLQIEPNILMALEKFIEVE